MGESGGMNFYFIFYLYIYFYFYFFTLKCFVCCVLLAYLYYMSCAHVHFNYISIHY